MRPNATFTPNWIARTIGPRAALRYVAAEARARRRQGAHLMHVIARAAG